MPIHFIDTDDGANIHRDEEGSDLPDDQAALDEATCTMAEMAREHLPRSKEPQRNLTLWVRDDEGRAILHLALTFAVKPLA